MWSLPALPLRGIGSTSGRSRTHRIIAILLKIVVVVASARRGAGSLYLSLASEALSQTCARVWPGSNKLSDWSAKPGSKSGYLALDGADMRRLQEHGCSKLDVEMEPGDLTVMVGGRTVHGSPAVVDGPTRWVTYSSWSPRNEAAV